MIEEVPPPLSSMPTGSDVLVFKNAILFASVLLKKADSARRESVLRELYGISSRFPVFRVFRDLWPLAPDSEPVLALLTVFTRDPVLRAADCSASRILRAHAATAFPAYCSVSVRRGLALKVRCEQRLKERLDGKEENKQ